MVLCTGTEYLCLHSPGKGTLVYPGPGAGDIPYNIKQMQQFHAFALGSFLIPFKREEYITQNAKKLKSAATSLE